MFSNFHQPVIHSVVKYLIPRYGTASLRFSSAADGADGGVPTHKVHKSANIFRMEFDIGVSCQDVTVVVVIYSQSIVDKYIIANYEKQLVS